MNIKLTLSYDGTSYLGWQNSIPASSQNLEISQNQCSKLNSIEATLQGVLEKILQQKVKLQAASRTDAGVHAEGQVVNFILETFRPLDQFNKSLNQLLPKTIRVKAIEKAADTFHATLDAKGKEYHYHLSQKKVHSPFERFFSWHYPFPLELEKMQVASQFFIGTHDFQTFGNAAHPKRKDTLRTIYRLDIIQENEALRFEIYGNHFLYKMVRNLVGTLLYVGRGKLTLKQAEQLIAAKDRTLAGLTAPAHGLFLKKVFYK